MGDYIHTIANAQPRNKPERCLEEPYSLPTRSARQKRCIQSIGASATSLGNLYAATRPSATY
ncbi:hypothetical protein F444_12120 [Phytophthora nicotianae P1976]|uniref:Uncharacterized protein n=1 Tax=Phytophthora nicotianae P1976 TaxID=1317066 RepID=A0A080ZY55_PHYNI|nr:hypothetical protein F444_12120 [Phytophthora nicotianae P1976]